MLMISVGHNSHVGSFLVLNLIMQLGMCESMLIFIVTFQHSCSFKMKTTDISCSFLVCLEFFHRFMVLSG